MTMTLDNTQHSRFGSAPGGMHFDYSATPASSAPQQQLPQPSFTNPWTSASSQPGVPAHSHPSHGIYHSPHHMNSIPMAAPKPHHQHGLPPHPIPQHPPHRSNTASSTSSLASYASSASGTAGSMISSSYEPSSAAHHGLLGMPHDVLSMNRLPPPSAAFGDYSTTASPVSATYATSSGAPYDTLEYAANALRDMADDRRSFAEAIDASQGMLAMSQETPRANAYDARHRDSADSYGFPNSAAHSNNSSISSHTGGTFNSYYADSISEYSTAGSDIESVASRSSLGPRMPGTSSLMTSGVPPAPHTMMSQFSSKMAGSVQKKHKCKVCDKRFTRPSSLQTHMYSHTGEKPFACEIDGCGRHFSVVSNLRRHMKVHKVDPRSGSEDQEQQSD